MKKIGKIERIGLNLDCKKKRYDGFRRQEKEIMRILDKVPLSFLDALLQHLRNLKNLEQENAHNKSEDMFMIYFEKIMK